MPDFTFQCSKCNRRVPTSQVRLLPGGKHICFDCARYSPDTPARANRSTMETAAGGTPPAKTRYQCLKCKYEFWLKEGHALKCPYCNGERIEEKQGAAQKLLDMHLPMRDRTDE